LPSWPRNLDESVVRFWLARISFLVDCEDPVNVHRLPLRVKQILMKGV